MLVWGEPAQSPERRVTESEQCGRRANQDHRDLKDVVRRFAILYGVDRQIDAPAEYPRN